MLEEINAVFGKSFSVGSIYFMIYVMTACQSDPGACNCAKNSTKILSNEFDKELFDKCDRYMKKLSQGETVEYSRKMLKCGFK